MVIFPRTVLSWNVNSVEDINEHSLRLMLVVEPKLELLVIGIGNEEVTPDLINRITQIVKPYHIRVEILKTEAVWWICLWYDVNLCTNDDVFDPILGVHNIQFHERRKSIRSRSYDTTQENQI